ncbi:hypothetical protein DEO72_LG10g1589 [Vigna unguiculata]|uniref:Uncharacterized protein n=1 Tax=Vigna unguiculata TaxID=3917 RepID=A0A4D6NCV9_VIGUN|nr:hypothetical protein DEO72_LG10g1589 [Vigna unguiculata]
MKGRRRVMGCGVLSCRPDTTGLRGVGGMPGTPHSCLVYTSRCVYETAVGRARHPTYPPQTGCVRPDTTGLRGVGGMPGTPHSCLVYTSRCVYETAVGRARHPTYPPQTGCVRSAAQDTPTHHPSPSMHTGWGVASGNRPPNLTFDTSGSPAAATSCAAAQLVAFAGEPDVLKVRLGVRFPLATTHPV